MIGVETGLLLLADRLRAELRGEHRLRAAPEAETVLRVPRSEEVVAVGATGVHRRGRRAGRHPQRAGEHVRDCADPRAPGCALRASSCRAVLLARRTRKK